MKKKSFILCLILILTMIASAAFAEGEIAVRIDSVNVEFNDEIGRPFIDENNRTLVPFRAALEAYGADVEWDGTTKTAKGIKGDIIIEIPIGEKHIVRNGEIIESDTAAIVKDGRTYLPIRNVIEAFGSEVQWDESLRTVVITSEPFDAKAKILEAYEKSYAWKNYDMHMLMDIAMTIPDETGNLQNIDIQMDIDATAFMDPMKIKMNANMITDLAEGLPLPVMNMYMVADENKFTSYTTTVDLATGEFKWVKQELEDESFAELLDPNNEEMKALNEKSMKEVKYLGRYTEEDLNIEKYEVVITYKGFDEIMEQAFSLVSGSISSEQMQMSLDLFNNLDDMKYIIYIDETSGEFAKMEMDLSSMVTSIMEQMMDKAAVGIPEGVSEEELEELNNAFAEFMENMNIKMTAVVEYLNINTAEDFEIPEEALNAITMEEYLEEIELLLEEIEVDEAKEQEVDEEVETEQETLEEKDE